MNLGISNGRTITNPTPADIREAVRGLHSSEDGFLVLGPDDLTYIQCSGSRKKGFALEYQDGSVERHYRAKRADFDADTIAAKFADYATGGEAWKEGVEWEEFSW